MKKKFDLVGFSIGEDNSCTASGGFIGDVTGQTFGQSVVFTEDGEIPLTYTSVGLQPQDASTVMTLADGPLDVNKSGQRMAIYCKIAVNTCSVDLNIAGLTGIATITFTKETQAVDLTWIYQSQTRKGWILSGTSGNPIITADEGEWPLSRRIPEYTVAGLSGGTQPDIIESHIIYVSDGAAGNPILAFCDGTNWLRSDTGAAVSAS